MQAETVVNQGVPLPAHAGEVLRRKVINDLEQAITRADTIAAMKITNSHPVPLAESRNVSHRLRLALSVMAEDGFGLPT